MLQNAYFLAKIGADTAENEQHFAEILPKLGNYPTGRMRRTPPSPAPWDPATGKRRRRATGKRRRRAPAGPAARLNTFKF